MHPSVHARTTPEKPAYIMAATGETVTYGELEARSNRLAQLFRAKGLKPGDHIALMMENQARFYEVCWAAQRSGLYFTAISTRLTAPEAAYIVNDCGARLLVVSHALAKVAEELASQIPAVETRLMTDGAIAGYEAYETAVDGYPATPIADEISGVDMLYSSGTTGRPKGVKVPLAGDPIDYVTPTAQATRALYNFSADCIYLSPAPLYHAAPLRFNMWVMRVGGTCIIMDHFDAENYLRLLQEYRATHTQLVPTMFVRMLKLPEETRARYDVSSLRVAVHAAAPCPVDVKRRMIEWWGPILLEYYAGTEANGMTFINSHDWLKHPGSVGRPLVAQLHIVGEDGEEVPQGEPGTIYFSGGPDFSYHNDAEKTAQTRNDRGWSTLGDVGYVDEDGFLYLTDRKAFMIISGGVNIYPQEVENLLIGHPAVADVAVFGVPNEEFGEEVKAVVQPMEWSEAGPALAQELIAYCRQHLAHLKCPRSVDFEAELPRHPTGKLYKRLLRDRYWGKKDSRIV
ncbi:AMP-binding protein [Iodidimonas sp. SYSU 1G8]|uniref:AMP-binding protein n=1 Tax=Iodidimonas sp. SYSU 1G8 TaxID=3133967 RepID=UPI0031FF3949